MSYTLEENNINNLYSNNINSDNIIFFNMKFIKNNKYKTLNTFKSKANGYFVNNIDKIKSRYTDFKLELLILNNQKEYIIELDISKINEKDIIHKEKDLYLELSVIDNYIIGYYNLRNYYTILIQEPLKQVCSS